MRTPVSITNPMRSSSVTPIIHNHHNGDLNHHQIPSPTPSPNWIPPPTAYIKLNCDGAWDKLTNLMGIGVVARDSEGRLIAGSSKSGLAASALEAEAMAASSAMELAKKFRFQSVIFELDSQNLVDAINGSKTTPH
ncbi:hypothetical protein ACLB2K_050664 [Fragaria x ananassa]